MTSEIVSYKLKNNELVKSQEVAFLDNKTLQDDNRSWYYTPNFVCAKDYVLEKDGNREETDGWKWYDTPPQEYLIWKFNNEKV